MECHDPHKRAILVKDNCAECHEKAAASFANNIHAKDGIECFACHMPKMSKSAIKVNKYTGDVRSHIFKISTDPKASAFTTDRKKTARKKPMLLDWSPLNFPASDAILAEMSNGHQLKQKKIHK